MKIADWLRDPPDRVVMGPTPILNKNVYYTEGFTCETVPLISAKMHSILDSYPEGVGLAANQVELEAPIFIVKWNRKRYTFAGPEEMFIKSDLVYMEESCLSFPGIVKIIGRPRKIKISYYNEKCKLICQTYTGMMSRIIQHEISHLKGLTIME